MYKSFRILGLFLVFIGLSAESLAEENASKVLQTKLTNMEQFSADFAQAVSDNSGEIIHEAKGKLIMARPAKLRWETLSPEETLLIADGESVWNIDTFVEQVTVLNQSTAVADNPFILLTTTEAETWNQYNVVRNEADVDSFTVTPKKGNGQIERLTLTFRNGYLTSLTMLDAQEQTSHLAFSDIKTDFVPDDSLFESSIPEGFMVDDQR